MADVAVDKVDVAVNFQGSTINGVRTWFSETVNSVRQGDDEALTTIMLSLSFLIAGVYVYRRL